MATVEWRSEDIEVDIKEEENEPELIFPYVEADPLNPPPPAPDSKSEYAVEVEDMVEHEDETIPNSVNEVGNEVRCSVGEREVVLEDIIKDFGNAEERVECKKLKKELEEERSSNTLLHMQKERIERDLYWTRVQAHEFYREMIWFMKCNPTVFYGIERVVELQRWFEKTEMVFGISECAEGKKVKFAAATLQGPALTWWNTKVATMGLEAVNQIPLTEMKQMMTAEFCPA
ncbi:hypothetical protein Tco_0480946 [Tanacetum coccineum]